MAWRGGRRVSGGRRRWGAGILESRYEGAGPPVIQKGYKIGISSDFWNRYEEDIQLAQDLGAHPCRGSCSIRRPTGRIDRQCNVVPMHPVAQPTGP